MKKWRTFELTGYYYGMSLSAFEDMITRAKKIIKSNYPDVNIEDLTINIENDCGYYSIILEFQSEETELEKVDKLKKENAEKERKLREFKKFLEEHPEVRDEIL